MSRFPIINTKPEPTIIQAQLFLSNREVLTKREVGARTTTPTHKQNAPPHPPTKSPRPPSRAISSSQYNQQHNQAYLRQTQASIPTIPRTSTDTKLGSLELHSSEQRLLCATGQVRLRLPLDLGYKCPVTQTSQFN